MSKLDELLRELCPDGVEYERDSMNVCTFKCSNWLATANESRVIRRLA